MALNIKIGFHLSPDDAGYPGFDDGGIRISVDGIVLTRYKNFQDECARYDVAGESLDAPGEYVGESLDLSLKQLKQAIIRFQSGEFECYEAIPAKMKAEPGFSRVILSFCDGEHARIAFQPESAEYGSYFPTEVTVGYAIDPNQMCHELVGCYEECVTFAENAYGEYEDMDEEMNEIRDWADEHIQDLLAVTSDK